MLGSGAALFGKPRSGERVQPTAQAVGKGCKGKQAPKERKNVSHTAGNVVLHLIF
jgi:hypothetical protein